eukprot:4494807-Pyramimonas_sp.AAC.4
MEAAFIEYKNKKGFTSRAMGYKKASDDDQLVQEDGEAGETDKVQSYEQAYAEFIEKNYQGKVESWNQFDKAKAAVRAMIRHGVMDPRALYNSATPPTRVNSNQPACAF